MIQPYLLSETLNDSDLRVGTGAWSESGAKSQLVLPNTEPRYEDSLVTSKALTINVDINSPLESDWRNTYSNYYYEANRIVEKVDDYLSDEFGIDFTRRANRIGHLVPVNRDKCCSSCAG